MSCRCLRDADDDQHEVACFEKALEFLDAQPVLFIRSLLNMGTYTPLRSDVEAGASWVRCDVHMGSPNHTRLPAQVKPAGFQSGILDPAVDWCLLEDGASLPCSEPHDYDVSGVPEADAPESYPGEGELVAPRRSDVSRVRAVVPLHGTDLGGRLSAT